jgi:DtxR family Mn-dependent transcriptional regulator
MVIIDSFLFSLYSGVEYRKANMLGRKNLPSEIQPPGQQRSYIVKTEEALTATVEEYLETIYNMAAEKEIVIGARLAEKFHVAPPTVTETLKRLVKAGYVEMDQRRQVTLTEAGYRAAEAVLRRHRLTERFLVDMLGMQWHEVHEEACRLEHFISGAVEARVLASLNFPTTCPHGNPIPGQVPSARTYLQDQKAIRLSMVPSGKTVKILCISEVVEDEEALIHYLHEKGLTPGTELQVLPPAEATGDSQESDFRLLVGDQEIRINKTVPEKIWVTQV